MSHFIGPLLLIAIVLLAVTFDVMWNNEDDE